MVMLVVCGTPLGIEAWMIHGTEKVKGVLGGLLSGDTHYAGLAYPLVIRDTPFVCLAIMQLLYKPSTVTRNMPIS